MTTRRLMARMARTVEEAEALAERFPDLSDYEVVEHVEYVTRYALNRAERREAVEAYDRAARLAVGV